MLLVTKEGKNKARKLSYFLRNFSSAFLIIFTERRVVDVQENTYTLASGSYSLYLLSSCNSGEAKNATYIFQFVCLFVFKASGFPYRSCTDFDLGMIIT